MRNVPLYTFIYKHLQTLRTQGFQINHSNNSDRNTFYVQIPSDQSTLAQQYTPSPWLLHEQHISIEQHDDPSNLAMGVHITLVHRRHNKKTTLTAKTHVFLNRNNLQPNGCYQQRILEHHADGSVSTIFAEDYLQAKPQTIKPYPGILFSIQDLNQMASVCIRYALTLDAQRVSTYIARYNESQALERQITALLHEKKINYLSIANKLLTELNTILHELDAYNEGKLFVMGNLIAAHIAELAQQDGKHSAASPEIIAPEKNNDTDTLNLSTLNPSTDRSIKSDKRAQEAAKQADLKNSIVNQINDILAQEQTLPDQQEAFYATLVQLIDAIFVFEYTNSTRNGQDFITEQRARLNPNYLDLLALLETKARLGEVDSLPAILSVVECRYDLVPLFSKLLTLIDDWKDDTECRNLSRSIHCFYQQSLLFQAFVRFKLETIECKQERFMLADNSHIIMNLLGELYCANKLDAFRLYLELGCSPEGKHARVDRIIFNAVQMIVLLSPGFKQHSVKPYMQALFTHGAVETITSNYAQGSIKTIFLANHVPADQRYATFFNEVANPYAKKSLFQCKTINSNPAVGQESVQLQELTKQKNILRFTWLTNRSHNPEIIQTIAELVSLKTRLIELIMMLQVSNFIVSFIPSTKGGVAFCQNQLDIQETFNQNNQFSDEDNGPMTAGKTASNEACCVNISHENHPPQREEDIAFSTRKKMLICVYLPSGKESHLLASAIAIYSTIEPLLVALSDDEKRKLINELRRELIESELRGDPPFEQLNRCYATIIVQGMLSKMTARDYKTMFNLFKKYGGLIDQKLDESENKTALITIYNNINYLFSSSHLHPQIQNELAPEIEFMRNALKHVTETRKLSLDTQAEAIDKTPGVS